MTKEFDSQEIARVFDAYPPQIREKLMRVRQLIFDTAATTEGVGAIEEALRWGEPSYLTTQSKSGTIIHIDSKNASEYGVYVHCQTDLIARFESLHPGRFRVDGSRGVLFADSDTFPETELHEFVSMALTYRLDKKSRKSG